MTWLAALSENLLTYTALSNQIGSNLHSLIGRPEHAALSRVLIIVAPKYPIDSQTAYFGAEEHPVEIRLKAFVASLQKDRLRDSLEHGLPSKFPVRVTLYPSTNGIRD